MRRTAPLLLAIMLLGASACNYPIPTPEHIPPASARVDPAIFPLPVENLQLDPSPTPFAPAAATQTAPPPVPTPEPSSTPWPTPDAYADLDILHLRERSYGGGELLIREMLASKDAFTRSLITFPSDELTIYGFMNVPHGEGPFPVVIVIHGYIEPSAYQTLAYTTRYADALARAGYLVIHPNLRGYPPSDSGSNDFRVGFAVDILNLIEAIKSQGGQPGSLEKADPERIGLWGHSMGGGISIRTITASPDVDAAVLYGSMSADDRLNYERIFNVFTEHKRGIFEVQAPEEVFARISPANFLEQVEAAVSIHHGDADATVPVEWSLDLCTRLQELGKDVECFTYPDQPHTFQGEEDQVFIRRTIAFFNRELKQ